MQGLQRLSAWSSRAACARAVGVYKGGLSGASNTSGTHKDRRRLSCQANLQIYEAVSNTILPGAKID